MSATPRSLADDLRRRTPEQLEHLLVQRSDLLRPAPGSLADLARRANEMTSTALAVGQLTASELDTLYAACALAPDHKITAPTLQQALDTTDPAVADALEVLWGLALLWGPAADLRIPLAVRELAGTHPCGLDLVVRRRDPRTVIFPLDALEDPGSFDSAPAGTAELLTELVWLNPQLARPGGEPDALLTWLNRQGLLVPVGDSAWVLPRDLSLRLRGGRLLQRPFATPPEPAGKPWPAQQVAATAGHAADQFLRTVDRICYSISLHPPALRRQGGLSGRTWQARAEELQVTPADLALVLELLTRCGWLTTDSSGSLSLTAAYQAGTDQPRAERWYTLATSWLELARRPWIDRSGRAGEAVQQPLEPGLDDDQAPARRQDLLTALRSAGTALTVSQVLPWLTWRRPRTLPDPEEIGCLLGQTELIGITGLGALSPAGGLLSLGSPASEVIASLTADLPDTRDRLLLQADLTATAVDPLPAATERRLNRVADYESGGGATVFRFTPESLARGLAHGESADHLLAWLTELSATEVPRTLAVLISDVSRQRGRVRLVTSAVILTGDPEALDQVLSGDVAAELRLTRICDHTIAVAPPESGPGATRTTADQDWQERVIGRLRAAGVEVAESAVAAPPAPIAGREEPVPEVRAPEEALAARLVRALRAIEFGPEAVAAGPGPTATPASDPEPEPDRTRGLPELLEVAAAAMGTVALEFSDETGSIRRHLVVPIEVAGGTVTVLDQGAAAESTPDHVEPGSDGPSIRTIPLSRVLGISPGTAG